MRNLYDYQRNFTEIVYVLWQVPAGIKSHEENGVCQTSSAKGKRRLLINNE